MAKGKNPTETSSPGRKAIKVEQSIRTASFNVTPDSWLNQAVLVNVWAEKKESSKEDNDSVYDTLNFEFRGIGYVTEGDTPHVPRYVDTKFAILGDAKSGTSAQDLIQWQDESVAQIYDTYAGLKANMKVHGGKGLGYVEGQDEAPWDLFYESVAKSFNEGRNGGPIYKTAEGKFIPIYLRLTYDDYGNLQLPLSNFIDIIREGRNTLLRKGKDSQYVAKSSRRKTGGENAAGAMTGGPNLPSGF